jgi:phosphoenolpyruvate carboxykinase (ATP)
LHPTKYATLFGEKMEKHETNVWLVNTGWTGGAFGTGSRMKLSYTRAIITAALEGKLDEVEYKSHSIFGFQVPQSCPNVPSEVLNPRNTWRNPEEYDLQAKILAKAFRENFKNFEDFATTDILEGAPLG